MSRAAGASRTARDRSVQKPGQPPPTGSEFDIIIIGGGTMGLAAAYYAARAGCRTLLLERFEFWNKKASSGGYSRIFRVMHSHSDLERGTAMVRLAEISLALWQEIEAAGGGKQLLNRRPLLFYGTPNSHSGPEGNLSDMEETMSRLGVPFARLEASDLSQRFPVFKTIPGNYFGLVQPNSAVIRVRDSIELFQNLAEREGALLLENQAATVWEPNRHSRYQVRCRAGTYSTKHLILCPGAWTNEVLCPFNRTLELEIWQMTVAYFEADTARYQYPLWYEFGSSKDRLFYGFPPDEFPGYIKVSVDFTHDKFSSPDKCTYQPDEKILDKIKTFLQERFRGVQNRPIRVSTCLYTMASDRQRILGLLPGFDSVTGDRGRVAIFTGDSGRGFKFTPLFGRALVELATTGKTYYNIEPFSPKRKDAKGQAMFSRLR